MSDNKHSMEDQTLSTRFRTSLGKYIDDAPLTALALPTPGPANYVPRAVSSGFHFSILGFPF
jgi:hypothetical protein